MYPWDDVLEPHEEVAMTLDPDGPVRLWDELWIDEVDLPADLPTRRRAAVAEAAAQAEPVTGDGRGAVGVRRYGPGCVALADRELVVDLSGLEECDALLTRALGRLRIRALTREARVELRDPPPALATELRRCGV
jgi:hypothetical protein